jgi:hypothetical protein
MPRVVASRRRLVARGKIVDNVVLPRPQVANSGSPQVANSRPSLRNGLGVVLFAAMQLAAVIGICFLLGAWGRSFQNPLEATIQNPLEATLFAAILLGILSMVTLIGQ